MREYAGKINLGEKDVPVEFDLYYYYYYYYYYSEAAKDVSYILRV
jgi:hypothetical protein